MQKLILDRSQVQYELKSVEVEIRIIEIASLSCGIHRGRLDSVMKDHISKLLPKKISKNIFKNFENFREIFAFSRFRKSEIFSKNRKIEKIEKIKNFRKFSKTEI